MSFSPGDFLSEEAGGATPEWVLITALIIAMTVAVVQIVSLAAQDPVTGLGAFLASREVEI